MLLPVVRSTSIAAVAAVLVLSSHGPARADLFAPDAFEVSVQADTVTVRHLRAEYNCCMVEAQYDVEVGLPVIEIVETEYTPVPCDCHCLFDLSVTITDVPPGEYELRFHWYDYGDWVWESAALPVLVPEVGQSEPPSVVAVEQSDCYFVATPVEDEGVAETTWTAVKGVYR
jgi:hypothetical protein